MVSGRMVSGTLFGAPDPNCATAFDTEGTEPYGPLRLLKGKGYLTPFPLISRDRHFDVVRGLERIDW
jgi:hypothetical protein